MTERASDPMEYPQLERRIRSHGARSRVLGSFCWLLIGYGMNAGDSIQVHAADSTWLLARGSAGGTGYVTGQLPLNLSLAWEVETKEAIETTPVIDGRSVYVADAMGGVESLALSDGKSQWRVELDTIFISSPTMYLPQMLDPASVTNQLPRVGTPVGAEQLATLRKAIGPTLLLGDVDGYLYAIDPADGTVRWKYETGGEISAPVTLFLANSDEPHLRVLATSQDGTLYCLELADGELAWTYETNDQIRCAASIGDGKTFLGGCDGALHVVDLLTGKASGEVVPLGGPTGSTPAVDGTSVFLPIMDSVLFRFEIGGEEAVWQYEDPERTQEYRNSPALGPHRVVVSSSNRQVDAIDRETGEHQWRYTLRKKADASPLIVGNDVWIASTDGVLSRLNLKTGELRWQYEVRGSFYASPAVLKESLVITDDRGVVRCFVGNAGSGS
ncbi:MAG: PQQ-binding-like beta-propeller repeat protein [Planctomycetota bacterium]